MGKNDQGGLLTPEMARAYAPLVKVLEMRYDALNRRICLDRKEPPDGSGGSIVRRTYFQYYPSGELAQEFGLESDGGFHAKRRYVYREAFVSEMVYEKASDGDWTRGFVIAERTGRPEQVVTSQGDVLWETIYDAYGAAEVSVAALGMPLRYPGQIDDGEGYGVYNWHRTYIPELGIYTSLDPLFQNPGALYGYAGANPVWNVDPEGLWFSQAAGGLVGGFLGGYAAFEGIRQAKTLGIQVSTKTKVLAVTAGFLTGAVSGIVATAPPTGTVVGVSIIFALLSNPMVLLATSDDISHKDILDALEKIKENREQFKKDLEQLENDCQW